MRNLAIFSLLAALAAPLVPVNAHAGETGAALLQRWSALNEACRGGPGDSPETTKACDERNRVERALFAKGYCYVGNSGAESRWEKGPAAKWTRRGETAICHE